MGFQLPGIESLGDLRGKKVLVRVDFNTPVHLVDGRTEVSDDFRIRATLPLLESLLAQGAYVTCMTHFGRPKGQPNPEYSVEPIRRRLEELCPGVELKENLRFNAGEEANDPAFGASLVEGFDCYVNEAFGASHRAHASIMIPPTLIPSAAGPNLIREVETILGALEAPVRPFVAIVGGAKVKDKLAITRVLTEKADVVIVGGGMAYTFEVADGRTIGGSLFDESNVENCRNLLATGKIRIPTDSRGLTNGEPFGPQGGTAAVIEFDENIPADSMGLDIGFSSAEAFAEEIARAGTILWNGPMGVFEDPRFASGTERIARAVAAAPGFSVVGGGDSVAAIQKFHLENEVDFVSTGGGASLELVEQGDLPGLQALRQSEKN